MESPIFIALDLLKIEIWDRNLLEFSVSLFNFLLLFVAQIEDMLIYLIILASLPVSQDQIKGGSYKFSWIILTCFPTACQLYSQKRKPLIKDFLLFQATL